jgi:hypothetical protein
MTEVNLASGVSDVNVNVTGGAPVQVVFEQPEPRQVVLSLANTVIATGSGEELNGYPSIEVPTGFSVSGSETDTISISYAEGYSLPTNEKQSDWDSAFDDRLKWDGGSADLDPSTGRTSLELGGAATLDVGTEVGTVAAGDDSRFTTDLAYDAETREITSSTGTSATLSLVTATDAGLIPAPPEGAPTGKVFDDSLQWVEPTGGASLEVSAIPHTTAELAPDGVEDFAIAGGDLFHLLSVTASTPAWVRVYGTAAARDADTRTEPGGTPPGAGNDYYAELATVAAPQTIRFSPVPLVQGTSGDAFIRVKNMDAVSRAITLNFAVLTLR